MDRADKNRLGESIKIDGLNDPEMDKYIPSDLKEKLVDEVEMAKELPSAQPEFITGRTSNTDMVWICNE